jgi:hypothetical protein
MKMFFLFVLAALFGGTTMAQIQDPVTWTYTAKKINATSYEVRLRATLENGWHIYSQSTPDGGPVPTAISFSRNPLVSVNGPAKEVGKLEQKHEPLFGVDVKQYSNQVDFVQTVVVRGKAKTSLSGGIEFMTCNDRECLPPKTQKFSIALK